MKRSIKVLLLLLGCFLCFMSCEDRFRKTVYGRDILGFSMENKTLRTSHGAIQAPQAGYYINETDNLLSIQSELDLIDKLAIYLGSGSRRFPFISISFPLEGLKAGVSYQPIIELKYWYLPGNPNRKDIYTFVDIWDASLYVRFWNPETGVLAGDFTFKGAYTDTTGRVHKVRVRDGGFDMKTRLSEDWRDTYHAYVLYH